MLRYRWSVTNAPHFGGLTVGQQVPPPAWPSAKATKIAHPVRFLLSAQRDGIGMSMVLRCVTEEHNSLFEKQGGPQNTTTHLLTAVPWSGHGGGDTRRKQSVRPFPLSEP